MPFIIRWASCLECGSVPACPSRACPKDERGWHQGVATACAVPRGAGHAPTRVGHQDATLLVSYGWPVVTKSGQATIHCRFRIRPFADP
jgi:hypothetical protein